MALVKATPVVRLLPLDLRCHLLFTLGLRIPPEIQAKIMLFKTAFETLDKARKAKEAAMLLLVQYKVCDDCYAMESCAGKEWRPVAEFGALYAGPSFMNHKCWFCVRYYCCMYSADIAACYSVRRLWEPARVRLYNAFVQRLVDLMNDSHPMLTSISRACSLKAGAPPQVRSRKAMWNLYKSMLTYVKEIVQFEQERILQDIVSGAYEESSVLFPF